MARVPRHHPKSGRPDRPGFRRGPLTPRGDDVYNWADDLEKEADARRVAALASPAMATVLHVGNRVVYAEPPPGQRVRHGPVEELTFAHEGQEAAGHGDE